MLLGEVLQDTAINPRLLLSPKTIGMLKNVHERNDLINDRLLRDSHHFIPTDSSHVWWTEAIMGLGVKRINISGIENLDQARERAKNGSIVRVTPNHDTDGDGTGFRKGLKQSGREDLAEDLIYSAGVNMHVRFWTRALLGCDKMVYFPTPYDLKELKTLADNPELTVDQQKLVKEAGASYLKLARRSMRTVRDLGEQGILNVVYVQGGRDKKGGMARRGEPEIFKYFETKKPGEDIQIVPVAHHGLRPLYTPGKPWRIFGRETLDIIIGEPYSARVIERMENLPEWGKGVPAHKIDVVMANVAALNWEWVNPSVREPYMRLKESFEEALAKAA